MYKRILKIITAVFVVLTLVIPATIIKLPGLHERYAMAEEIDSNAWQKYLEANAVDDADGVAPEKIVQDDSTDSGQNNGQLNIQLPSEIKESDLSLQNDYLTQTLYVSMDVDTTNYFTDYKIAGSPDHISSMQYYRQGDKGVIAIAMDKVYEISHTVDEDGLHLDFIDPHDIYDKVIVIDAGHGSRMTGAVRNGIEEKNINLDIVLCLKELLDNYSGDKKIGVYYTRTTDANPTLQQRAALANKADADLFISVHNNSSGSGNFTSAHGTQVLYSQSDTKELGSKHLAQICLDNVTATTGNSSFGLLEADDIYIIRTSEAPVALVEVGFMTNREELDKLSDPAYQKSAAQGIYNAIMQAFDEGY